MGSDSDPLDTIPATGTPLHNHVRTAVDPNPGARLGRYVVLERVGSGGMGIVFAAYDPELDRKVALKLLYPGEASAQLRREAKAMAKLNHPNVVVVHDVGEAGGQVYVAMEFVAGGTLRERDYDGWRDAVACFVAAGLGLEAAHSAGLVHGDFKPDNVLVGTDDRILVSDFGLAREADSSSSERGTPAYMAPECQRGAAADPRSDQFSYCVALWEALHGKRPFSGDSLAALAAAVVADDRATPTRADVPRAVALIVDRGLSPDPAHRFEDMSQLLAALRSTISKERSRWTLVAAAATTGVITVTAAMFVGGNECATAAQLAAKTWGDTRPRIETAFHDAALPYGDAALESTLDSLDTYVDTWAKASAETCVAEDARAPATAACLEQRRGELAIVLELFASADATIVHNTSRVLSGLVPVDGCSPSAGESDTPPADAAQIAVARKQQFAARVQFLAGRYEEAHKAAVVAVEQAVSLGDAPSQARALRLQAKILHFQDRHDEAQPLLLRSIELAHKAGDDETVALAAISLAHALSDSGDHEGALRWARFARASAERIGSTDVAAESLNALAAAEIGAKRFERARDYLDRALALAAVDGLETSTYGLAALGNRAIVSAELGELDDAAASFARLLQLRRNKHGHRHPTVAYALMNAARVEMKRGRYLDASRQLDETMTVLQSNGMEDTPAALNALRLLQGASTARGDTESTILYAERALAIRQRQYGEEHEETAMETANLAIARVETDAADARELALRAIKIYERRFGVDSPALANPLQTLGYAYELTGKADEALAAYRRSAQVLETSGDSLKRADALSKLALHVLSVERTDEAGALATQAIALLEDFPESDELTFARFVRALVRLERGEAVLAELEFIVARWDDARDRSALRARYGLGLAYARAGRREDAAAQLGALQEAALLANGAQAKRWAEALRRELERQPSRTPRK